VRAAFFFLARSEQLRTRKDIFFFFLLEKSFFYAEVICQAKSFTNIFKFFVNSSCVFFFLSE